MRIVEPTRLLAEAADVLAPVRDDVVVIGAAALQASLSGTESTITPTRDVDVVVPTTQAADVVRELEKADLERSTEPDEAAFTWTRGELKVQLVRDFHPFPKGPARHLPQNPVFGMSARLEHRDLIGFGDAPETPRLWCANAGCLLALKEAAFGRTRRGERSVAERDFHDAYLLLEHRGEQVVLDVKRANYDVRARAHNAITLLSAENDATATAARQIVRLDQRLTQREAEAMVRRAARRVARLLGENG